MRVFIINADYPDFLRNLYLNTPDLVEASYREQMRARNDSLFGVADFYSRNFIAQGHEAVECHVNNRWLQYTWAREHDIKVTTPAQPTARSWRRYLKGIGGRARTILRHLSSGSGLIGISEWDVRILRSQIEEFRPDVILNQEMYLVRSPVLNRVGHGAKIVGQNAAILPEGENYSAYDLLISSLPNYVEFFRKFGKPAALNRLAFEPKVLEALGRQPERDIPLSFVGSLSPNHAERIAFLEYVARRSPLKVWGNGIERLPASSPLHASYQGEAWARDMYQILRRSKVTLNKHIDIAENMANNMRLYEATGMGAALLTDNKANLSEIFIPDEQVVAYDNEEDCVRKIDMLLGDETRRAGIAVAGQRQAVEVQNYSNRVSEMLQLFDRMF
jgi:hypothetical protein